MLLLLRGLTERGVGGTLCAVRGSAILERAREMGLDCIELSRAHDLSLRLYCEFGALLRRLRPDLAHMHSRRGADLMGGLAARRNGIPAILSRRVDNPQPKALARFKYGLYRKVAVVSEGIRKVALQAGVPADKLALVRDGVDVRLWQSPAPRAAFAREFGLQPSALVLGMVAQFIQRKGHRHLLQALPGLLRAHPRLQVLLFGAGPLEGDIRSQVRDLGLQGRVRFAGFRSDMTRWMGCLDALAHPADAEGMGVALLQAAAAGVPVVATDAGGIPEAVRPGASALLVPVGDAEQLREKLDALLRSEERRKSMGSAGREFAARELSADRMVEGNLALYRQVLEARA